MAGRRFRPLVRLVLAGTLLLLARLWQVQVVEHEIWANEAANLVRSGQVLPYERGRITDAGGHVVARDQEVYQVDLVYREFRRGHPLGQVAHARSALEMRAVPLAEASERLVEGALALVRLSPRELREFERGAGLGFGGTQIPGTDRPSHEHRTSRASDVRFYVGRLLEITRRERVAWRKALRRDGPESFVQIAADLRPRSSLDELELHLERRLVRSLEDLEGLARMLHESQEAEGAPPAPRASIGSADPLAGLLADLEESRRLVEDSTASALFREAAGFPPGRVEDSVLAAYVDLSWIARRLRWDAERTGAWLRAARGTWLGWRDYLAVEEIAAELRAGSSRWEKPDRILTACATLFAEGGLLRRLAAGGEEEEPGWRRLDRLAVLGGLPRLFDLADPWGEDPPPVLPVRDPALARLVLHGEERWMLLGYADLWGRTGGLSRHEQEAEARRVAELWRAALDRGWRRDPFLAACTDLLHRWEGLFQGAVEERLAELHRRAERGGELSAQGLLRLRDGALDRASERARYTLRDQGSRRRRIARNPDYTVVHMLTRYQERFAGFQVSEVHLRVLDVEDELLRRSLAHLIGAVREHSVLELRRQREMREELGQLMARGTRSVKEDQLLRELVVQVAQPEEAQGGSGLEAYFDPELSGHNGYQERRGLQAADQPLFRSGGWSLEPVDGEDLSLTLDLELQRAAQEVLARPAWDPDPAWRDEAWLANPVGAIVLITADGDVLAAASAPLEDADPPGGRISHRRLHMERTLLKPGFQPPGSVFKPFVAAWAMERCGWDPARVLECIPTRGRLAEYGSLHCWKSWGHGALDLREALSASCNVYLAQVGEALPPAELLSAARAFGFGQPTGVRSMEEPRAGLREHECAGVYRRSLGPFERRLFGNGLGVIEATPMQVARATAGLATGRLPELRLVDRVGGRELPRRSQPIPISEGVLGIVREAMIAVTSERGGTAFSAGLRAENLGFSVAAKTGSADLVSTGDEAGPGRNPKHTWFAGWLPAESPAYVLVVFCDSTRVTSGHSTVWIARQFLEHASVQERLR